MEELFGLRQAAFSRSPESGVIERLKVGWPAFVPPTFSRHRGCVLLRDGDLIQNTVQMPAIQPTCMRCGAHSFCQGKLRHSLVGSG